MTVAPSRRCPELGIGWRSTLGPGRRSASRYRRETNTMPQWAGSCWYYLRYLDPTNDRALVDPEVERYWMGDRRRRQQTGGGVDLYVGGVEHAVLHLLYSRFWHKVLFDLGHVSTPEPFQRLFNQGYVSAAAYTDSAGAARRGGRGGRDASGGFESTTAAPVTREFGKMGKSLKNSVTPDEIYDAYGADTLAPLRDVRRPAGRRAGRGNTGDIIGVHRFLQRLWRNMVDEDTGGAAGVDDAADDGTPPGPAPDHRRPCARAWRRCASTPRSPGSPSSTTTSPRPSARRRRRARWPSRWC